MIPSRLTLLFALSFVASAAFGSDLVGLRVEPASRSLHGSGASQQFLAIGRYADGTERDLTENARWQVSDPSLAELSKDALLSVRKEGALTFTARPLAGKSAQAKVQISDIGETRQFQFARDIGGILTRQGCNGQAVMAV